jgi:hypothetical protein
MKSIPNISKETYTIIIGLESQAQVDSPSYKLCDLESGIQIL